ncbi:MAG: methyl-accepting chemotaxis protein [Spirochaetales bacterium]|nr:methyl-accepting chemotaxis protein [Spirochaetales bacterium]
MKKLQTKFILCFAGMGILIALGVGFVMYAGYAGYIKSSYQEVLENVGDLVEKQFPVLSEPGRIINEGKANSQAYWQIPRDLKLIADSFDLAYIYYLVKDGDGYSFVLDIDDLDELTDANDAFEAYPDVPDEVDLAMTTGKRQLSSPYTDEWGAFVSLFVPIFSANQVVGILGLDYDLTFVRRLENRALLVLGAAFVLAVFISVLTAILVSRSLVTPIKKMAQAGNALANMQFDIPIPTGRKDEIGDMQRSLNTIKEELQKTILEINNEHLGQKNISGNLRASILDSSSGLNVITRHMDTVENKAELQMKEVTQTSESIEGIIKHIQSLDTAAESQGNNIDQSSSSIEQMVKDLDSVRTEVRRVHETTSRLGAASEAGQTMLQNLTAELGRIAEQSAFLEKANATLAGIAAQTSMLAMNAAIEAAHAGEAGKGFAVVAGEVRNLADSSNKESASISREIKKMRNEIEQIRRVSKETVDTMEGMFHEVTDMQKAFTSVNAAVETQASHGSRVLATLTSLRQEAEQVKNGSGEIARESHLIHDFIESLKDISREVSDSVLDVHRACREIAQSLDVAQKIAEGRYLAPPDSLSEE